MKVILLAAGTGSRLTPLTSILPKCLMPINGRPLIEYWLKNLTNIGLSSILVNLHYLPEIVDEWLSGSTYTNTVKTVYEKTILGTAGTLIANKNFINNQTTLLIHADNLCDADLTDFIHAHSNRPPGTEITMMTFKTTTPQSCGIVELDSNGIIHRFHEKSPNPPGNLANAAVYIIEPSVIDFLTKLDKPVNDFSTEVIPNYMGRIYSYHNNVYHRDIGNLESLLAAQIEFDGLAHVPEGHDSWAKLCKKDSFALTNHFFNALPSSLNPIKMNAPDNLTGQSTNDSINQPSGNENTKNFLFFPEVKPDFSSKQIYEQYGLRSLAFCACR